MSGEIFVAKGGSVAFIGDKRVAFTEGQTVREGHPIMKGLEHLFEPFHVDFEVDETPAPKEPAKAEAPKEPEAKAVRAWAAESGIEVPARGKLPAEVVEQYQAAQQEA